ncbi:MAG: DUF547 domain-containing protein [Flavobacteriaceae bacterium]|nr:DUF547 domain-containing protein [Flavobacteriaceae bacterium]
MKNTFILFLILFVSLNSDAQTTIFNSLLQKHVSNNGVVNYEAFKKDEQKLEIFIKYLKNTTPNTSWSINKKRAFWINVYNAYTIQLILDNYPVESIMDIKKNGTSAWKIPFVKVGGKTYTLDQIEHEILRKELFDPRIHVGVNCASISCPKLANKAFTEENIDKELTNLMTAFVNDKTRNKITKNSIEISEIFNWFKDDFTKNGSLVDYLNKYSSTQINSNAKISFLTYNWKLNRK